MVISTTVNHDDATFGFEVTANQIVFDDPQAAAVTAVNDTGLDSGAGEGSFATFNGVVANFFIGQYGTAYTAAHNDPTGLKIEIEKADFSIIEVSSATYQIINHQVVFDTAPPAGSRIYNLEYERAASGYTVDSIAYDRPASGSTVSSIAYDRAASGSTVSSIAYDRPASGYTVDTINYTTSGTSVDTIEYSTASAGPYTLQKEGSSYTAANNDTANLEIVINDQTQPTNTYNISGDQITFTAGNEKSASDNVTSIKHAQADVVFEPTETLTVEIDGVLQDPDTYEIINDSQIRFDTAPADGATTTLILHSEEEAEYTFGIRATDRSEYMNIAIRYIFAMFVSKPGIALITPKREVGLVEVDYDSPDSPVVRLAAATYNEGENVTLSLTAGTAGNLAGSGLTFESITGNRYC